MRGLGGVSGRHARGGRLKHTCAQQRLAHGGQTQLQQRARRGTACVARAEDEQTAEEKPPPSKLATQLAALQRARFASDSAVAGDTNMAFRSPLSTLDIADNASVAAAPRYTHRRRFRCMLYTLLLNRLPCSHTVHKYNLAFKRCPCALASPSERQHSSRVAPQLCR